MRWQPRWEPLQNNAIGQGGRVRLRPQHPSHAEANVLSTQHHQQSRAASFRADALALSPQGCQHRHIGIEAAQAEAQSSAKNDCRVRAGERYVEIMSGLVTRDLSGSDSELPLPLLP